MFRTGLLYITRSLVLYTQQYEVDIAIGVYTVLHSTLLYSTVYTAIGIITKVNQ